MEETVGVPCHACSPYFILSQLHGKAISRDVVGLSWRAEHKPCGESIGSEASGEVVQCCGCATASGLQEVANSAFVTIRMGKSRWRCLAQPKCQGLIVLISFGAGEVSS